MSNHVPAFVKRNDIARALGVNPVTITNRIRRGSLPKPDCHDHRSIGWAATTLQQADPGLFKILSLYYTQAA